MLHVSVPQSHNQASTEEQIKKIRYGSVLRYRPDDGSVELKHVALYISVFNNKLMC